MSYAGDITPQQAWDLLEKDSHAVLVDVRTEAEWRFVGVPDITSLGKQLVLAQWIRFSDGATNPTFIEELQKAGITAESPVIFLCRSGQRSIAAAIAATTAGIAPSYNILDGFEGGLDQDSHRGSSGWRAVGLPWRQS